MRKVFASVLAVTGLILGWRASHEDAWSNWGFADAQALFTLRHWREDGFLFHRGLMVPQGYSKAVRFLDDPDLRHHAHGISPQSAPGVGPRLRYTHYPSGFMYPYYVLGSEDPRVVRIWALGISLAAVWLWFTVFRELAGDAVALAAGLYVLSSPPFVDYATALTNQPLDDLLRASFALCVIRGWTRRAWVVAFLLPLVSLDSVVFLPVFRVGWDLSRGERRPGRWIALLLALLLAHALQLCQNASYLGVSGAFADILATAGAKWHGSGIPALCEETTAALPLLDWGIAGILLAAVGVWKSGGGKPLLLLALAGLPFALLFPFAGRMTYEGRQLLPAAALLVGTATVSFRRSLLAGAFAALAWAAQAAFLAPSIHWVAPVIRDSPEIRLAKEVRREFPGDHLVFSLDGFRPPLFYVKGYPQVHPLLEWYAGGAVLCFERPEDLQTDLARLRSRAGPFRAVLVSGAPVEGFREVEGRWVGELRYTPSP